MIRGVLNENERKTTHSMRAVSFNYAPNENYFIINDLHQSGEERKITHE